MTEAAVAVASAVILPETEDDINEPAAPSLKRRPSSVSPHHPKRRRLSQNEAKKAPVETATSTEKPREGQLSERRRSGQLEERKRGQRLFGALLGTLSQSSSSAAQKRRADIESKQRAKLRLQTEEENETRKAKLEALTEARREEQKDFDRQSVKIKHATLLAQARFLQTKTEPRLYYKPWELLPEEEAKIKMQVSDVEKLVAEETRQMRGPDHTTSKGTSEETGERPGDNKQENGKSTNTEVAEEGKGKGTDRSDVAMSETPSELPEAIKDNQDDGAEVVEGEEDTVIY